MGKMERVVQLCERALEIRPESYEAAQLVSMAHEHAGRATERETAARRALGLVEKYLELEPDDPRALTSRPRMRFESANESAVSSGPSG